MQVFMNPMLYRAVGSAQALAAELQSMSSSISRLMLVERCSLDFRVFQCACKATSAAAPSKNPSIITM